MTKNKILNIDQHSILIVSHNNEDYISLTDMAHSQLEDVIIIKWLSLKNTIEYIGEWEAMYNPDFNYNEFGIIKVLIHQGLRQSDRLYQHNQITITQMKSLLDYKNLKYLE